MTAACEGPDAKVLRLSVAWEGQDVKVDTEKLKGSILGMGNPLLDVSNKVGNDFLEKHKIEANNAILAEEDKGHLAIFKELRAMEGTKYIPGGATQNSIRVAQWALQKEKEDKTTSFTSYMGSVGKDQVADQMQSLMHQAGVTTSYHKDDVRTGQCAVCVNGANNEHRSLVADLAAANNYKESHLQENMNLLEQAKLVYSAGFFTTVSPESMKVAAKHCLDNDKLYCLNFSAPFIVEVPPFLAVVKDVMPMVDFLFCNETEAACFAKSMEWGITDLHEIAKKIGEMSSEKKKPRTVVITQGPDPTIICVNGETRTFPIVKLEKSQLVDTNGAGDAYVGGFLAKLVQGASLDVCAQNGAETAAMIVQRDGCDLP